MKIPFNRPVIAGNELRYIEQAVRNGQLAGDGPFTSRCQELLRSKLDSHAVLLTHSCTAALEMAAILLDLKDGDEVIMPSFTFVSTANAVVLRGARPVFVDIRPDTLNLNEELVEEAITERTRSIWPIHYAGVSAEMDRFSAVARKYGLPIVEDAAQGLGSTYRNSPIGTLGDMAAFSFHETKNIISGEGGALAINNPKYLERAEIIREKGTNRKRFFRGQIDKYSWVDIGSSFLPGELIAAYLCGQIEKSDDINSARMSAWRTYYEAFDHLKNKGISLPIVPENCGHNAHLFYLIMPSGEIRDEFIHRMKSDGITTPFHYVPLHSSPAGKAFGRTSNEQLPITDDVSSRLVRLPLFPDVGKSLDVIIDKSLQHISALT